MWSIETMAFGGPTWVEWSPHDNVNIFQCEVLPLLLRWGWTDHASLWSGLLFFFFLIFILRFLSSNIKITLRYVCKMYNENEKAIWCKRSILDWEDTISKAILEKKIKQWSWNYYWPYVCKSVCQLICAPIHMLEGAW